MPFQSIAAIRAANKRAGRYFFSHDTMKFFDSKVLPGLYGGRYFITSEQAPTWGTDHGYERPPRKYTIRIARDDGDIDTIGEFQGYSTADAARADARNLARGGVATRSGRWMFS